MTSKQESSTCCLESGHIFEHQSFFSLYWLVYKSVMVLKFNKLKTHSKRATYASSLPSVVVIPWFGLFSLAWHPMARYWATSGWTRLSICVLLAGSISSLCLLPARSLMHSADSPVRVQLPFTTALGLRARESGRLWCWARHSLSGLQASACPLQLYTKESLVKWF